ncbi:MAG: glycoside hydrolase family 43 protein [Eubacteriales bacterium]|nr:glycoside hydrolase family 43 protein [Eubacteriales bacterium]
MKNGQCWPDDSGKLIQAHGGMIARFGEKWYWYGENKDIDNCVRDGKLTSRVDVVGVSCYSSEDLHTWHYEGLALSAVHGQPGHLLSPERVMERPKVIFSKKTGKYVMWFHCDSADYTFAHAGCAVSDTPEGPFEFLYAKLPCGRDCRDMTVYEDPTDGKAYLVHSGDWNKTMYFSELNEERTDFTGVCYAHMINQMREAPALIRHEGLHYCVTSGCTGWAPNSALYATCEHLSTGMRLIDNPCEGENYRGTFGAQSTYIFEADGQAYLMLDHWKPQDLRHSAYSFLPVTFENGRMTVRWTDEF